MRGLYERVVNLRLRLEFIEQATPEIHRQANTIAAPLESLGQKLKGRPNHAQLDFVASRLLDIQRELHELFIRQLNPRLESQADG